MELAPQKGGWSPLWVALPFLIAVALIGLKVHWIFMPPQDPNFSWEAMHSRRDLGYVEAESWRIDEDRCLLQVTAPNGSVYPIPRGCKLRELFESWEVKLRLVCKWRVKTRDWLYYESGAHSECRILDVQYLATREEGTR